MPQIDIRDYPEIINLINAIVSSKGIVEVKNEGKNNKVNLVVVEVKRTVKTEKKKNTQEQ